MVGEMLTTRRTFAASVNEDDGAAGADIKAQQKDPGKK